MRNTYTQDGLLDTTFETDYAEFKDGIMDTVRSITVRLYRGNKLIDEKGLVQQENGTYSLVGNETLYQYDIRGNQTLQVRILDGTIWSKEWKKYNSQGENIRGVLLFKKIDSVNNGLILAKPVRKEKIQYDTTSYIHQYDDRGNLVRSIISEGDGKVQKIRMTEYAGSEKTVTYVINPQGDTIEKFRFERDGDLVKQIAVIKGDIGSDTVWYKGKNII